MLVLSRLAARVVPDGVVVRLLRLGCQDTGRRAIAGSVADGAHVVRAAPPAPLVLRGIPLSSVGPETRRRAMVTYAVVRCFRVGNTV